MTEQDLLDVLLELTGRSWRRELTRWVHGTRELPLHEQLTRHGVAVLEEPAQMAQALGLRVAESGGSVQIKVVLRGGAAELAGFAAGDEWLALEIGRGSSAQGWRLGRLDELPMVAAPGQSVTALVSRDRKLLRLRLKLPRGITTWRLAVRDAKAVTAWLGDGR